MVLVVLESIDSTQLYIKERFSQIGFQNQYYVLAKDQTQGYGRLGAKWHTQKDASFILSFSFKNPTVCKESEIVFFIACVLGSLLSDYQISYTVKWPNDIYVDGHKIAGILVERYEDQFIIGVGVNLNQKEFPLELGSRPISLYQVIDEPTSPERFFYLFLQKFEELLEKWISGEFCPTKEVDSCLHFKNERVQIAISETDVQEGLLMGLNAQNGALILKIDENEREFYAGRIQKI